MNDCCICLEAMDDDATTHTIDGCGHAFHASCLITWMRQGRMSCPACRHDLAAQNMDGMTVRARARHIRAKARNARAPEELKRLVQIVRRAEQKEKDHAAEMRAFQREHKDVLSKVQTMRTRRWMASRKVMELMRALGTYHSTEFPLPPLVVHNYH